MDARDDLEDVRDTGDDTVVVDTHVVVNVVAVIVLVGGGQAGRRVGRKADRQADRQAGVGEAALLDTDRCVYGSGTAFYTLTQSDRAVRGWPRLGYYGITDYGHTKAKSLIQIPVPNKYLGCGYKGFVFCRNNG